MSYTVNTPEGSVIGNVLNATTTPATIAANAFRKLLVIANASSDTALFVFGSGGNAGEGLPVAPFGALTITPDMGAKGAWSVATSTGTASVRYLEVI